MDDKNRGLYKKFNTVTRTDGGSGLGRKHHGCEYFVLDLDHDSYTEAAMWAYAAACEDEYPLLASDIRKRVCANGVQQKSKNK